MLTNFDEYNYESQISMPPINEASEAIAAPVAQPSNMPYFGNDSQIFQAPPISNMCSYFRDNNFSYVPVENNTNYYLNSQMGKKVNVEFCIGDKLFSKEGTLTSVGSDYILLISKECGSKVMCDMDAIKFITVIEEKEYSELGV